MIGGICPICSAGPFGQLAQHFRKHKMRLVDYLAPGPRKCKQCGAEFELSPKDDADRGPKREFCSRRCVTDFHSGQRNPNYKGGSLCRSTGYRTVYVEGKEQYEHRVVMEGLVGRALTTEEIVHHKNGDKADNRPANLELMGRAEHTKKHHEMTAHRS